MEGPRQTQALRLASSCYSLPNLRPCSRLSRARLVISHSPLTVTMYGHKASKSAWRTRFSAIEKLCSESGVPRRKASTRSQGSIRSRRGATLQKGDVQGVAKGMEDPIRVNFLYVLLSPQLLGSFIAANLSRYPPPASLPCASPLRLQHVELVYCSHTACPSSPPPSPHTSRGHWVGPVPRLQVHLHHSRGRSQHRRTIPQHLIKPDFAFIPLLYCTHPSTSSPRLVSKTPWLES